MKGVYFFFHNSPAEDYTVDREFGGQRDLWDMMWEGYEEEDIKKEFPEVFRAFENRTPRK